MPYVPFSASDPKSVVILTYQRCGSTFFGQVFNQNPEAFYLYEPLDSLYTALYGTLEGWNAGQDITAHWDGSERYLILLITLLFVVELRPCVHKLRQTWHSQAAKLNSHNQN